MRIRCLVLHPENTKQCRFRGEVISVGDPVTDHEHHETIDGDRWDNTDYIDTAPRSIGDARTTMLQMARRVQPAAGVAAMSISVMDFDGETYNPEVDQGRLGRQLKAVYDILFDGEPHTLAEISQRTGEPEASISARIRDLRKERFGAHEVNAQRVSEEQGTWVYRLLRPQGRTSRPHLRDYG